MKRKKQVVSIAVLLLFCTAICAVAYMTQGSVWAKQAVKLNQSELTMVVGEGRTLKLNVKTEAGFHGKVQNKILLL